jgi:outer membrane protein assembly factor BamB
MVLHCLAALSLGGGVSVHAAVASADHADVTTYHNDNQRTGGNLSERTLTLANVTPKTFGLLRRLPVDGVVDAQPLVLQAYPMGDGAAHDVVFVATENASVYAFDARTGQALWRRSLLAAGETASDDRDCDQVAPTIGITATPVIDRGAGTLFVVAMSKTTSTGAYHQRLHALSLATGSDSAGSAVDIAASVPGGGPGAVDGRIQFNPAQYKERAALLLAGGVIYTAWASHCDIQPYTGWIIAYAEHGLRQTAVFNTEPNGAVRGNSGEASFWNSNSGPAADAEGNLYAMTANGYFDATLSPLGFPSGGDYGNSILKLAPPAGNALSVLDYFTMYNANPESEDDIDLGSGGLMLLPDQIDASGAARHLAVGAGKDKNIYVVDRDHLGKFNSMNNHHAYQVLVDAFPHARCGAGVYGAPVYFNGMVYFGPNGDVVQGFRLAGARLPAVATTVALASTRSCYPGAPLSISADGTSNGILWAVKNGSPQGTLYAFDAGALNVTLYDSSSAGARDQFGPGSKFTPPTVANGLVFVATQAAGGRSAVAVFGLEPHADSLNDTRASSTR